MNTFQMIVATTAPGSTRSSALVGVVVVTLVTVCLLGALTWVFLRFRSTDLVFRKATSSVRAEVFAAQTLNEFGPAAGGGSKDGVLVASGPVSEIRIADDGLRTEMAGAPVPLEDFYATAMTAKPVRPAGPVTQALATPGAHPQLSAEFDEALMVLVEGIKRLAVEVEQVAVAGAGPEPERATRVVDAFMVGIGALPLGGVVAVSAGRAADVADVDPLEDAL